MDCMDCQVTTDINLSVEYYSLNSSGDMSLDSATNFTYNVQGYINATLPDNVNASTDMAPYISPINVKESCGDELKDINNSTLNFETALGDSITGLHKYNWSETWDCK
tara:strand:+ start:5186 stop:5509 length:324 start_codon:yes stop_codon:yes gene_type:complete